MTAKPRRPLMMAALSLGAALAAVAALLLLTQAASPSQANPQLQTAVDLIAIDTDPTGNGATSLAAIQTCRELPTGDFDVDVIIDRTPADRDLVGLQFVIRFDPSKIAFKSADMNLILSSTGGSLFPGNGNPVNQGADPGNANLEVWFFGAVQIGGSTLSDVAGVAGRLTFTALAGGTTAIEILPSSPVEPGFQTKVINKDNTLIPVTKLAAGTIAISPSTCQQAPPPPVHTPASASTPTTGETPGPDGATPQPGVTPTPPPPAVATATAVAAAAASATATATATADAETPGPGTPEADLNSGEQTSGGDDSLVLFIVIGVLAGLAAAAATAWVIRKRIASQRGPGDG